jgi:hypothetical protein
MTNVIHLDDSNKELAKGYGPPWMKLGPTMVRYPRGKLIKWLRGRAKTSMKRRAR